MKDRHLAVNWIDGMKVSRRHFEETNRYIADQIRIVNYVSITPFNYGILQQAHAGAENFVCQLSCDASRNIRVSIQACQALATDGSHIDINAHNSLIFNTGLSEVMREYELNPNQAQSFYAVLSVHVFNTAAYGEPAPDEMPPRHPFVIPEYAVSIVPAQHIKSGQWGGNHLIIGKLAYLHNELNVVQEYIPASSRVGNLPVLRNWYTRFETLIGEVETYSFRIIQKIKLKSQKNNLSDSVLALADGLAGCIGLINSRFRMVIPHEPPVEMVLVMIQIAERIRVEMECLPDREKEELLSYLAEWADGTPGSIHAQLNSLLQIPYTHTDCLPVLQAVEVFFAMWSALFNKLSQLEFIGKRKGQQVFIIESPVHEPTPVIEKPKSRWSPI